MRKLAGLFALLIIVGVVAAACTDEDGPKSRNDLNADIELNANFQRTINFQEAEALYPSPNQENFPLREALVKYTERQDLINHPWYTYILGENGNVVGFYVTETAPINTCNFLSSSQKVISVEGGRYVTDAPSLDGIYYGGSGAQATCAWFAFDAASDALIIIQGVDFFTSDIPLSLEAEAITVAVQ